MTAGERVFSVVRGRLYERLPALALPLGKLSCREADVTAAGTDGRAALFAPGFLEREFLAGSELPERLTLHLLLHLMLGHPQNRRGREKALWDTACDLAVLLVRHALLPQEREAPDAFSARCKLQVKKAGRAEEIYALLQAEPELLTPDERLSAVLESIPDGRRCAPQTGLLPPVKGTKRAFRRSGGSCRSRCRKSLLSEAGRAVRSSRSSRIRAKARRLPPCCTSCPRRARTVMCPVRNFNMPGISTGWSITAVCR